MKPKEIEALESYFKTDNEHWNEHAFKLLCSVVEEGNFENPKTPLELFDTGTTIFTAHHQTPLKAIQLFGTATEKVKLTHVQKLFVYERVYKYVRETEFDEIDLSEAKDLLKCQTERLRNDQPKIEYNKPLTGNIRDTLKEMMQNEIANLPSTLENLDPVQRLNILCKLMPYVLPKVVSVTHRLGEPDELKIRRFHD